MFDRLTSSCSVSEPAKLSVMSTSMVSRNLCCMALLQRILPAAASSKLASLASTKNLQQQQQQSSTNGRTGGSTREAAWQFGQASQGVASFKLALLASTKKPAAQVATQVAAQVAGQVAGQRKLLGNLIKPLRVWRPPSLAGLHEAPAATHRWQHN